MASIQRRKTDACSSALACACFIMAAAPVAFAQTAADWTVYRPDMKFSDVFGRTIDVRQAGTTAPLIEPTLSDVAKSDASNAAAHAALNDLLASVKKPAAANCQALASLKLPWMRVLRAEAVAAAKDVKAYCTVTAVIDKEINLKVDLPAAQDWNGKFLMTVSGGYNGTLDNGLRPGALHRGYATAATDTGHKPPEDGKNNANYQIGEASWAYRNPDRILNWGHRGTHLAQANAKLIIQAYYKKPIARSYFYGTSGGGRVAMMQAQRYASDFDGIVAGCPAFGWTKGLAMNAAWSQQVMFPTVEDQWEARPAVPASKISLLDAAVHEKCDALDGLKDGSITNPMVCQFDPMKDLKRCPEGRDGADCFTTKQAEIIDRIHKGPSNSQGQVWSGYYYGGESIPGQWGAPTGAAHTIGNPRGANPIYPGRYQSRAYQLGNEALRYLVYGDPDYDLHSFNFETDMLDIEIASAQGDADNPDLTDLKNRNAKLIMFVGLSDWAVNGKSTVNYYDRLLATMGGKPNVQNFARLFLMPRIGHCSKPDPGQKTPNVADFLTAIEEWVEKGKAPESIVASHMAAGSGDDPPVGLPLAGAVDRTRPLCPYPQFATYKGSGSVDDAGNFTCK